MKNASFFEGAFLFLVLLLGEGDSEEVFHHQFRQSSGLGDLFLFRKVGISPNNRRNEVCGYLGSLPEGLVVTHLLLECFLLLRREAGFRVLRDFLWITHILND